MNEIDSKLNALAAAWIRTDILCREAEEEFRRRQEEIRQITRRLEDAMRDTDCEILVAQGYVFEVISGGISARPAGRIIGEK